MISTSEKGEQFSATVAANGEDGKGLKDGVIENWFAAPVTSRSTSAVRENSDASNARTYKAASPVSPFRIRMASCTS